MHPYLHHVRLGIKVVASVRFGSVWFGSVWFKFTHVGDGFRVENDLARMWV